MSVRSYGFSTVCKRKRPVALLVVFRLRRHSSKTLQARQLNTGRSNDGKGEDFVLSSKVFQMCELFSTNYLTQHSRVDVLLTTVSECFTCDDARIFVSDGPWTEMSVRSELEGERRRSQQFFQQCGQFFFFFARRPHHSTLLPAHLHLVEMSWESS